MRFQNQPTATLLRMMDLLESSHLPVPVDLSAELETRFIQLPKEEPQECPV